MMVEVLYDDVVETMESAERNCEARFVSARGQNVTPETSLLQLVAATT